MSGPPSRSHMPGMASITSTLKAQEVIQILDLQPHPEGGHYRETYRDVPTSGGRGACTAIYYLLALGEVSEWHRVTDAVEIWHWYAGAPLVLSTSPDGETASAEHLGPDIAAGQSPQLVIPAGHWQAAESLGAWTLTGCTVAPAFSFEGFEMAPPGWRPGSRPGQKD